MSIYASVFFSSSFSSACLLCSVQMCLLLFYLILLLFFSGLYVFFLMREKKGVDVDRGGDGEDIGAGGRKTIVRIYCIKNLFLIKENNYVL